MDRSKDADLTRCKPVFVKFRLMRCHCITPNHAEWGLVHYLSVSMDLLMKIPRDINVNVLLCALWMFSAVPDISSSSGYYLKMADESGNEMQSPSFSLDREFQLGCMGF